MALTRVQLLVLAGGAGSRLGKLTEDRAKPAVPFGGTFRLIDVPLSHAQHSHVPDVWLVEQFHPAPLADRSPSRRATRASTTSGTTARRKLVDQGRARALPLPGCWRDVGTVDAYWQAHMQLLADDPPLDLHDGTWPFSTPGARSDGAVPGCGAAVTRSLVSPGVASTGRCRGACSHRASSSTPVPSSATALCWTTSCSAAGPSSSGP